MKGEQNKEVKGEQTKEVDIKDVDGEIKRISHLLDIVKIYSKGKGVHIDVDIRSETKNSYHQFEKFRDMEHT